MQILFTIFDITRIITISAFYHTIAHSWHVLPRPLTLPRPLILRHMSSLTLYNSTQLQTLNPHLNSFTNYTIVLLNYKQSGCIVKMEQSYGVLENNATHSSSETFIMLFTSWVINRNSFSNSISLWTQLQQAKPVNLAEWHWKRDSNILILYLALQYRNTITIILNIILYLTCWQREILFSKSNFFKQPQI